MNKCRKCGNKNIISVEYSWDNPNHYDGVSEIDCLKCGYREGRWSGRELKGSEQEDSKERFKAWAK